MSDLDGMRVDWQRLPSFEPGPDAWSAIVARRRGVQRRRVLQRAGAGSVAVLGLAFAWLVGIPGRGIAPDGVPAAGGQQVVRSDGGGANERARMTVAVRQLDHRLQAALDRGAPAEEVAMLKRSRQQYVQALDGVGAGHGALVSL